MNRRDLLGGALLGAAGLRAPRGLAAKSAEPAGAFLTVEPLGGSLHLIRGGGGNVVVFDSPQGVLLVDGGAPEHSATVLRAVQKLTGKDKVHTLFNTHWHWDQTGSNAALGSAGTRIIAHENTRLWLATDVDSRWENRRYKRLPAKAQPTETFYDTGALDFGGEHIEYGYLAQAHTDGDIYVHFRDANVLAAGDVLSYGRYPIIDYSTNGWIGGMANATQSLLERSNAATRLIPGTGPAMTLADLQAEQAMLNDLKSKLAKLLAQGMSVQDMIDAAPTRDYDTKWGDPKLFISQAWPGLVQRARELGVSIV